jgi:hypothetical protein
MFNDALSSLCCIESNSRIVINVDLERMCNESVVDNTEVLPPHLSGATEKSHEKSTSVCGGMGSVPINRRAFLKKWHWHGFLSQ